MFIKTHDNKVGQKNNNNKYISLLDKDAIEEEEEDEVKVNDNVSIEKQATVC